MKAIGSLGLVLLIGTSQMSLQPKRPDLSGHWMADPTPADSDPRVPICGEECFITQTDEAVLVREQRTKTILSPAITFKFDGSPTSPPAPEGQPVAVVLQFRSTWKDDVLVITSESGAYKTVARLSLRDGRLTIEGERSGPPFPVFKRTYRKVVDAPLQQPERPTDASRR